MGNLSDDSGGNLGDELAAWDAATLRRRERSLREQALWSTTLAGLCIDAAERGVDVALVLTGGAGLQSGVVTAVGVDYAGLGLDGPTLVPFAAVAAVRRAPGLSGDRASDGLTFAAAVERLAEDHAAVAVTLDAGEVVTGSLRAAADGIILVDTTWIALDAVRALRVVR